MGPTVSESTVARQGHRYRLKAPGRTPCDVLVLEPGEGVVRVADLVPDQPWIGKVHNVPAAELHPQPMVYFHGEVPR